VRFVLAELICRRWKGAFGTWGCERAALLDEYIGRTQRNGTYRRLTVAPFAVLRRYQARGRRQWQKTRDDKSLQGTSVLARRQGQEICASATDEAKAPTFSVAFSLPLITLTLDFCALTPAQHATLPSRFSASSILSQLQPFPHALLSPLSVP
jgi:hypothetical protein